MYSALQVGKLSLLLREARSIPAIHNTATSHEQYSAELPRYMAFELAEKEWKLGFTIGLGQRLRLRTIPTRDLEALQWEIRRAKKRFGSPPTTPVMSLTVTITIRSLSSDKMHYPELKSG